MVCQTIHACLSTGVDGGKRVEESGKRAFEEVAFPKEDALISEERRFFGKYREKVINLMPLEYPRTPAKGRALLEIFCHQRLLTKSGRINDKDVFCS